MRAESWFSLSSYASSNRSSAYSSNSSHDIRAIHDSRVFNWCVLVKYVAAEGYNAYACALSHTQGHAYPYSYAKLLYIQNQTNCSLLPFFFLLFCWVTTNRYDKQNDANKPDEKIQSQASRGTEQALIVGPLNRPDHQTKAPGISKHPELQHTRYNLTQLLEL